jgi:hypothetical protein
MKKDIPFHKVEDVGMAVVPEKDKDGDEEWSVFLVNMSKEKLDGVIVSSTGYGTYQGRDVKTSTLRQFFETIPPEHAVKIELIETKLFGLNNEFWVSFWLDGEMYDRKYVFVPESILPDNFTTIPLLNKKGVLIV